MYVATCLPGGRGHSHGKAWQRGRMARGQAGAAQRGYADASSNILASALVAATWQSLILFCQRVQDSFLSLLCSPPTFSPLAPSLRCLLAKVNAFIASQKLKQQTENFPRPTHIAAISVFCLQSVRIFIAPT